jgi:hypothetical protein
VLWLQEKRIFSHRLLFEVSMLRIGRSCLLAASLFASSAWAQGPGVKYAAIVGGASLSDMTGVGATSSSRWGGTAGLMIGYNTWRTAIALEGNWVQEGGGDTRLDYIEVPLTLGAVAATGDGSMRGRLYSGVSVNFKVSCSSTVPTCDGAEGTTWGWPIGLQFAKIIEEKNSFVGFDIRYTVPLSDAYDALNIANRPWVFRLMFGKRLGAESTPPALNQ